LRFGEFRDSRVVLAAEDDCAPFAPEARYNRDDLKAASVGATEPAALGLDVNAQVLRGRAPRVAQGLNVNCLDQGHIVCVRQYSGMSPAKSNRLVDDILRVIDEFEQGAIDVERLQSALEACAAALDNSSRDVLDELRRVEADLETILFTMPLQDQTDAARVRVGELRDVISRGDPG
jgi:hypothetical protein